MFVTWSVEAGKILEPLIKQRLIAFRETLGHEDAIAPLDRLGARKNTDGYYTNLSIRIDELNQMIRTKEKPIQDIIEFYKNVIPPWVKKDQFSTPSKQLFAISPEEVFKGNEGNDEIALMVTTQLIQGLELDVLRKISPDARLAIVSVEHNQALVDIWKMYVKQVEIVIVLLGASFRHIREDLALPVERYLPLLNTDTLVAVDKKIRERMIPEN